jgi:hypothetical protein
MKTLSPGDTLRSIFRNSLIESTWPGYKTVHIGGIADAVQAIQADGVVSQDEKDAIHDLLDGEFEGHRIEFMGWNVFQQRTLQDAIGEPHSATGASEG